MTSKKLKYCTTGCTVFLLAVLIVLAFFGYRQGIFTNQESLQSFLNSCGIFAPLIFLLIQILQVLLSFVPGGVTLSAGVICFGALGGFFFNYTGILLGSCLNFYLARRYGVQIVHALVSDKTFGTVSAWLNKKSFTKAFAVAIFLPFFPDDFLCLVAGLSKMRFRIFFLILILCKPLTIAAYSFGFTGIQALFPHIF